MVSVIILYDHVSLQGAFHKNSPINVRRRGRTHGRALASAQR